MDHAPESHISQISTMWTILRNAHGADLDARTAAQVQFFERYQRAVEKYLMAVLREPNATGEVFSEFAEKFLTGGFHKADPERGQFRYYLKRSLVNAARSYLRKNNLQTANEFDENQVGAEDGLDAQFEAAWTEELLNKTWESLAQKQTETGRKYFVILKVAADNPDASGSELHQLAAAELKLADYPSGTWRKDLSRARTEFAHLLIQEIGHSIRSQSLDEIEAEAAASGLLPVCKNTLSRLRENAEPS